MSEVKQVNRKKLKGAKKVFSKAFGEVQGADEQILQRLSKDVHLTKVESVEECDIILAFCPIVSRIGTDIGACLEECKELGMLEKRLILVVLHHTFMSDYKVPDISRHVTRKNVLAVNFLFHSNSGGLLNCPQNDMSLQQISSEFCFKKNASKSAKRHKESQPANSDEASQKNASRHNKPQPAVKDEASQPAKKHKASQPADRNEASQPANTDEASQPAFLGTKKVFSEAFGEVLQCLSKDVNLTTVKSVEECDIILAFCPIVSRIGTDIGACLEECNELGMREKRLILVVLHHTFNQDYNVPDISRHVTRENVLAVNFLFHSSRGGLLNCPQNNKALQQISSEFCSKDKHGCCSALQIRLHTFWSNIRSFFRQIPYRCHCKTSN